MYKRQELKTVDGIIYGNDGDWVESLSALVEHHDGSLELLDWSKISKNTEWENVASSAIEEVDTLPETSLSRLIGRSQNQ